MARGRKKWMAAWLGCGFLCGAAVAQDSSDAVWSPTSSMMSAERRGHSMTALPNGRVVVIGGVRQQISQTLSSCEIFRPAINSWGSGGALRLARWEHSASLLPNGKILVAGGTYWNSKSGGRAEGTAGCEVYDPALRKSASTGAMVRPRTGHCAAALPDGRVLVAGGDSKAAPPYFSTDCEVYDPATGKWSLTGAMAQGRVLHRAAALPDGSILVVGGEFVGDALSGCEIFDPASQTWRDAAPLNVARAGHSLTAMSDGRLLACGGYETFRMNGEYGHQRGLASCEVYDPDADAWTFTGSLDTPRIMHTAARLADGRVLVSGGYDLDTTVPGSAYQDFSTSELYDPTSGAWSSTASMNGARFAHLAVSLPSGGALVTCGNNRSTGMAASAEIFDP